MENSDIVLAIWQSAVILSLLLVIAGVLRPSWFLFWIKEPKPFYMFVVGAVIFMASYFGYSLKVGSPLPIAAIHAVILFSILFLLIGMINPSWVFGTAKLDQRWVMAVAALLFMAFMTLQGMYYGPKKRPPAAASPTETHQPSGSTPPGPN